MSFIPGGGNSCMKGGYELSPASIGGDEMKGLVGGSRRRRLHRTKGKARRARVRSSSAGGSRKRGGKKSKKSGGKKSRKHRHSKRCHH